jgi:hypothetical protein
MKEADVLRGCLDLLAAKNVFHFRVNNTGIYDPTKKCFRSFQGIKGVPDIIAILPTMTKDGVIGQFLGIECKATKGKLSVEQQIFQDEIIGAGGIAITAHSVDELVEDLEELGC